MSYITSVERISFERGYNRGVEEEAQRFLERIRSLIIRLLTRKVGMISNAVLTQLDALSIERLESLGEALLDFESIEDLNAWLENER